MKRKTVNKLLATALSTVMVASVVGCGDTKTVTTPSTDATPSSSVAESSAPESTVEDEVGQYTVLTDADGNPIDLGGMEIQIKDWWSGDPVAPQNDYEEARDAYREWIQETYNFKIAEVGGGNWPGTTDMVEYSQTGGDDQNLVFVCATGKEVLAAGKNGLAYDLATLDCLDFSESKWNSSKVHELYSVGDSIYGMRAMEAEPRCGMYFNKRLVEEAGLNPQDFYTWQEDGSWTWDKFEEVLKQVQADTDNDGVIDRYALCDQDSVFYGMALASNGATFVEMKDGKFELTAGSDQFMEAMNWAVNIRKNYEMKYPEDAAWDYYRTAFPNGEAVFCPEAAYAMEPANMYGQMADDFGFICFPKGPNMNDYVNILTDNVYVIPACYDADRAWKIAFAYNLYTDPVPGFEDYSEMTARYLKGARDTETTDLTINRMLSNGTVLRHSFIEGMDVNGEFYWQLTEDNTPAKQMEAIKPVWQSYIDEANK